MDKNEVQKPTGVEEQDKLAVTVGKNLTRLRRMANMTQLDLAEKLNYSDKSVSKWEQGNG
ncbi:MAG: helix-turn-helix domain-containing protein, partial [Clostridiales bacterium]|nr:helix-turn-helix domain-containing protein [Clostridiales bacterium]